jgi:hypothetical protein
MAHDFAVTDAGAGVAEVAPRRMAAQIKRLPHLSNPPFFLTWHPLRWQFVQDEHSPEGEWLPVLGTLRLDPGVGGVDKGGDDSFARVEKQRLGWEVISWESVPPGTPNGRYIRAFPAKGPPGNDVYHVTAWETPRHMAGRVLPSRIDVAGYRAWLRWLVESGVVKPMPEAAVALQVAGQQQAIELMRGKADKFPHLEAKVEAAQARLRAMVGDDDVVEEVAVETAPAKPAARKRRGKGSDASAPVEEIEPLVPTDDPPDEEAG